MLPQSIIIAEIVTEDLMDIIECKWNVQEISIDSLKDQLARFP